MSINLVMDRDNQLINEDSKGALRQCLTTLCEYMQTRELVIWMRSKNVLTAVDVQHIEAKPVQYQKNSAIVTLIETKNQKAFDVFIQCLWETGQNHLASQVIDKLSNRTYADELLRSCKSQRQHTDRAQELDIERVQTSLKGMYLQRFRKINPFSLPFTFDIENTWVSLAMKEEKNQVLEQEQTDQNQTDQAQTLNMEENLASVTTSFMSPLTSDLAHPMRQQVPSSSLATDDHIELLKSAFVKAKMLIIEGKPATGKTSLMRRLAYEWAKGEQKLAHYDLVLYAEFREVCEHIHDSIIELVIEYISTYKSFMRGRTIEELALLLNSEEFNEEKQILLLIDGYDELALDKHCKELDEYLTTSALKSPLSFNVVLTTRPGYLGQHRGKKGRYVFADLLGFTTVEQKEKYILNHFKSFNTDCTKQIAAVRQLLQINDNMNKLAETPLFLTLICLVNERLENATLFELYCNVIWWMINRYQTDNPDRDVPSLFEFYEGSTDKFITIQNNYLQFPQILHLGKMAFNNLEKDVFHESDYKKYNVREIIQQVGLLRKDEFYENSFHLIITFAFPHRTMQEFLAAIYCFCSNEKFDHRFKSGFDTKKMTEYEQFLLRIALSNNITVNDETRKRYFDIIADLRLDLKFDALQTLSGINSKLLNWFLLQCNNIVSLNILYYTFDSNSQLFLASYPVLKNLKLNHCVIKRGAALSIAQFNAIANLKFNDCNIDLEAWQSIIKDIRESSVKYVKFKIHMDKYFPNSNRYEQCIDQLLLCNVKTEIELKIKNCTIQSDIWIDDMKNLHILTLRYCTFETNSKVSFKNCRACNSLQFKDCRFNVNTQLSIVNFPANHILRFEDCTFNVNTQLFFVNCPSNDILQFSNCAFGVNTQISVVNCPSNDILQFDNCAFGVNIQIGLSNCPASDHLQFNDCDSAVNMQIFSTN